MSEVHLVHCSLHKCLTVYFKRVAQMLLGRFQPWRGGYRHFNSDLDEFYRAVGKHRLISVNNRCVDLARLGKFRLTRFVRDPRDLVVSGYFYHRRGAEPWVTQSAPTEEDWYFANGNIPTGMRETDHSFAGYLQSVDEEAGLIAELEFRKHHFESLAAWPTEHEDILTLRYEDVIGNEVESFDSMFQFYGLSTIERQLGRRLVARYALGSSKSADAHVRNPKRGQWRDHFTPAVEAAFNAQHPGLLERLGYDG